MSFAAADCITCGGQAVCWHNESTVDVTSLPPPGPRQLLHATLCARPQPSAPSSFHSYNAQQVLEGLEQHACLAVCGTERQPAAEGVTVTGKCVLHTRTGALDLDPNLLERQARGCRLFVFAASQHTLSQRRLLLLQYAMVFRLRSSR